MPQLNCKKCQKPFYVTPWAYKRRKNPPGFCSMDCKTRFTREKHLKRDPNPNGLCFCGCGEKTPLALYTSETYQTVKGLSTRYLFGHAKREKARDKGGHGKLGFGRYKNNHGYIHIRFNTLPDKEQGLFKTMITRFAGFEAILEHRLIVARRLGRALIKRENVHHINGIRNDNREDNLELWQKYQPCGQRVSDLCIYCKGTGLASIAKKGLLPRGEGSGTKRRKTYLARLKPANR